ncbi:PAP2 superfamily phosphatase [Fervidicoccus fontis Kam940]|uniref:PAP2 superfamily phosphatase n=1 Tax=Fervidicoccus fontis (strain DSM 19380 / JCM 18336 / VKM B-2539 / Kam940) TaxID=1163730 RepID=I0A0G9_FERFK|nr:PAP2 superfamily phosphatase [Fervidicoccus fontis Kam940]
MIINTAVILALLILRIYGFFSFLDISINSSYGGKYNSFVEIFSETASIYSFVIIGGLIAIYQITRKKKFSKNLLDFASAFIISSVLVLILKDVTKVPRPNATVPPPAGFLSLLSDYYSFPSGHSTRASVASYYLSKKGKIASILSWIYTILIAISRIMLGVHWFSDVVFGIFLGIESSLLVEILSPQLDKLYIKLFGKNRIQLKNKEDGNN